MHLINIMPPILFIENYFTKSKKMWNRFYITGEEVLQGRIQDPVSEAAHRCFSIL